MKLGTHGHLLPRFIMTVAIRLLRFKLLRLCSVDSLCMKYEHGAMVERF